MSETVKINSFPAGKVEEARELLAKYTARFAKAALKAGTVAPEAPTLTASNAHNIISCTGCKTAGTMHDLGNDHECGDGYFANKLVVDLEVTAGKPVLAGWEFLAVVEPLVGGNLVNRVPGSDEAFDLTYYRTCDALTCDHCNTVRKRSETFVVRADGTDPAVSAGTVKKVGRNCLSYFLGGASPAELVARLGLEKALRELGEGGGGGYTEPHWSHEEFLSWTCSVVRKDGWVSKGAANAYNEAGGNKTATADRVHYFLIPPFERAAREEWRKDRIEYTPVEADKVKAAKVLEWATALEGKSDYEYKLSLVAKQPTVSLKHFGLYASAVGSYERAVEKLTYAAKRDAEVKATAPTGKGVEFEGEVIKTSVTESEQWGTTERMTVKVTNPDGSVWLAWGTIPSHLLNSVDGVRDELVGRKVAVKATLEAGKEANFVFMKRPSVGFADLFLHPVQKAPKKSKKVAAATEETV